MMRIKEKAVQRRAAANEAEEITDPKLLKMRDDMIIRGIGNETGEESSGFETNGLELVASDSNDPNVDSTDRNNDSNEVESNYCREYDDDLLITCEEVESHLDLNVPDLEFVEDELAAGLPAPISLESHVHALEIATGISDLENAPNQVIELENVSNISDAKLEIIEVTDFIELENVSNISDAKLEIIEVTDLETENPVYDNSNGLISTVNTATTFIGSEVLTNEPILNIYRAPSEQRVVDRLSMKELNGFECDEDITTPLDPQCVSCLLNTVETAVGAVGVVNVDSGLEEVVLEDSFCNGVYLSWNYPAKTVVVTGSFDDWKQTSVATQSPSGTVYFC